MATPSKTDRLRAVRDSTASRFERIDMNDALLPNKRASSSATAADTPVATKVRKLLEQTTAQVNEVMRTDAADSAHPTTTQVITSWFASDAQLERAFGACVRHAVQRGGFPEWDAEHRRAVESAAAPPDDVLIMDRMRLLRNTLLTSIMGNIAIEQADQTRRYAEEHADVAMREPKELCHENVRIMLAHLLLEPTPKLEQRKVAKDACYTCNTPLRANQSYVFTFVRHTALPVESPTDPSANNVVSTCTACTDLLKAWSHLVHYFRTLERRGAAFAKAGGFERADRERFVVEYFRRRKYGIKLLLNEMNKSIETLVRGFGIYLENLADEATVRASAGLFGDLFSHEDARANPTGRAPAELSSDVRFMIAGLALPSSARARFLGIIADSTNGV